MKPFIALAFTSALTLQGCAFAPGQYLDPDEFKEGAEAEHGTVQLVRITPEMLRQRHLEQAGTAQLQAERLPHRCQRPALHHRLGSP